MNAPDLSDAQFAVLRDVLARAAGLVVEPTRREALVQSVAARLRATGSGDVADYLPRLQDAVELQRLLDEVTVPETTFFRNLPQVRALSTAVLPALLDAARDRQRLRVWSAGCSTGEEPYTVAALLRELLPGRGAVDVQVLGTDVSERALAAARTGRYGARAVQSATPEQLARHFARRDDGRVEVRPEVRALVSLRHHNLVTDPAPFGPGEVDLVLCRNVTIYFARETTRALVGRFAQVLRPGGYLLLGHAETLWQVSDDFELVPVGSGADAAFVHRRREARSPAASRAPGPAAAGGVAGAAGAGCPAADPGGAPGVPAGGGPVRAAPVPRPRVGAADPGPRPAPAVPGPRTVPAPPAAAVRITDVRAALQEGRYDDAVALADALAAGAPVQPDGHYLRGLALVSLGRDGDALVALRKAVYLAPDAGLARFLLAGALARSGDPAAARREYAAAADTLGPRDAGAPELGGRRLGDLVALCRRLAGTLDRQEDPCTS